MHNAGKTRSVKTCTEIAKVLVMRVWDEAAPTARA